MTCDCRTKSKMEEINEIIARSQTRAQQLLASGAYGEDPLKTLTPSRDYLSLTLPSMPVGKKSISLLLNIFLNFKNVKEGV